MIDSTIEPSERVGTIIDHPDGRRVYVTAYFAEPIPVYLFRELERVAPFQNWEIVTVEEVEAAATGGDSE